MADDPRNGLWRWTCGHLAGACCGECRGELAARATAMTKEIERLRDRLAELEGRPSDG